MGKSLQSKVLAASEKDPGKGESIANISLRNPYLLTLLLIKLKLSTAVACAPVQIPDEVWPPRCGKVWVKSTSEGCG
jgi:hypothetical protein